MPAVDIGDAGTNSEFWDGISRRSVFNKMTTVQFVKILQGCDWDIGTSDEAAQWFAKHRHALCATKAVEDCVASAERGLRVPTGRSCTSACSQRW